MKKFITLFIFFVALLGVSFVHSNNGFTPNQIVFKQDQELYIINSEDGRVSVYSLTGELLSTIGYPAAGNPAEANLSENSPLPPAIIHFLLKNSFVHTTPVSNTALISGTIRDVSGTGLNNISLFLDLNGNGIFDEGEPLAVTDRDGNYTFTALYPGTYVVMLLPGQFTEWYQILMNPETIELAEGETYSGAYFMARIKSVTISGRVWDDANANGQLDLIENGLNGVTVFLDSNCNGTLDLGEPNTTTDTEGTYTFSDLENGFFYIRVEETGSLNGYSLTTSPYPVLFTTLTPGQIYDNAKFGYQYRILPVNTLKYPSKLAWGTDGKLYVSDYANNSVFIYDDSLNVQGELKDLDGPIGIAVDSVNNIYVINSGTNTVAKYDPSGNFMATIGQGLVPNPYDISLDRNDNIYILDSVNDRVFVFNSDGSSLLTTMGDSSIFTSALSIATNFRDDGNGNEIGEVYVADKEKCMIHIFDMAGVHKKSVGSCGSFYGMNWNAKFSGLMAVDIDQYGNIHGLDNSLNIVQMFDPQTGSYLGSYKAYLNENQYLLNLQSDISIHPADDRVIVSNVATKSMETVATVPVQ